MCEDEKGTIFTFSFRAVRSAPRLAFGLKPDWGKQGVQSVHVIVQFCKKRQACSNKVNTAPVTSVAVGEETSGNLFKSALCHEQWNPGTKAGRAPVTGPRKQYVLVSPVAVSSFSVIILQLSALHDESTALEGA